MCVFWVILFDFNNQKAQHLKKLTSSLSLKKGRIIKKGRKRSSRQQSSSLLDWLQRNNGKMLQTLLNYNKYRFAVYHNLFPHVSRWQHQPLVVLQLFCCLILSKTHKKSWRNQSIHTQFSEGLSVTTSILQMPRFVSIGFPFHLGAKMPYSMWFASVLI